MRVYDWHEYEKLSLIFERDLIFITPTEGYTNKCWQN